MYVYVCFFQKLHYVTEILEVEWNVTNNDAADVQLYVSHPSRGVTALAGVIDVKKDLNTDNIFSEVTMYYSKNGISYTLTPFGSPRGKATRLVNVMYKDYVMDALVKCCDNPLVIEGKFEPPIITKRKMTLKDCIPEVDNYVSSMRLGFYRLEGYSRGELQSKAKILIKLDAEESYD